MKTKWYMVLMMLVFGTGMCISIYAQTDDAQCPAIITQALELATDFCDDLGRNVACYGNNRVSAQFISDSTAQAFSQPADIAPLAEVVNISTAGLDIDQNIWGLALMNVQANIPDTIPGQAVLFFLMGEAQVENRSIGDLPPVVPVNVTITATDRVNIRSGAGTNFNPLGAVSPNSVWSAVGVSDDGTWVQIDYNGTPGWVSRSLIEPADTVAFASLPMGNSSPLSPMQAFYFTTGTGIPACRQAPDAIVVQSPQRLSVNLSINGANVKIGSTIVLQTVLDENPTAPTPEGCRRTEAIVLDGELEVNRGRMTIPIGHSASFTACPDEGGEFIPQDDWEAEGIVPEERLQAFSVLETLPEGMLHYPITIPSREEIERALRPTSTPQPRPISTIPPERPAITTTPPPQTGVDCSGFVALAPTDAVVWGSQEFRWTPASGAEFYYVTIERTDNLPGSVLFTQVGGVGTSVFMDLGVAAIYRLGRSDMLAWKVEAWARNANNEAYKACQTDLIRVRRMIPSFATICDQMDGYEAGFNTCIKKDTTAEIIVVPQ